LRVYEIQTKYKAVGIIPDLKAIQSASDIAAYFRGAFDGNPMQEQFWCLILNASNKPMARHLCTMGLANQTQIHPREAFKVAIREGGVSVIFAHNHPSGSTRPSNEDIEVTRRLCEAGKILDIPVLDHIIIADEGYNSLRAMNPSIFG